MADKATRIEQLIADIAQLEAVLGSGATSSTVDGQQTTFDLKHCRKQLRAKRAELARLQGKRVPRPIAGSFDLSGME